MWRPLFLLFISAINLKATISQIAFHDSDLEVEVVSIQPIVVDGTIVDYDFFSESFYFNVVSDSRIVRNQPNYLEFNTQIYINPDTTYGIIAHLNENFSYQGMYDDKVMSTSVYYKIFSPNLTPPEFSEIIRMRSPLNTDVQSWGIALPTIGGTSNPLLSEGEQMLIEFFYSVNIGSWDDLGMQRTYTFNNNSENYKLTVIAAPEPSALSLLAVGLGGLAMLRRRRS